MEAKLTDYFGKSAVFLSHSGYTALFLPEMGANLISLMFRDIDVLRTPKHPGELENNPYSYGIPILYPPNRVQGAAFTYDGKRYTLPANMPDGSCLHGLLHRSPWRVDRLGADDKCAYVVASCGGADDQRLAESFGHEIVFQIEYSLSKRGLTQRVSVINSGSNIFPFGLAFHTAFRIPFCLQSRPENVVLRMPLASRCRLNAKTFYPELVDDALDDFELMIAKEGYPPLNRVIDRLYKRAFERPNEALLIDTEAQYQVRYRADDRYRYWIIWNDTAKEGFVGIEPQTWLSNALRFAESGVKDLGIIEIHPNAKETLTTWISVEKLQDELLIRNTP